MDIQERELHSGNLIQYAINIALHSDAHQKISFKLNVVIGLTKSYIFDSSLDDHGLHSRSQNDKKTRTHANHLIVRLNDDAKTFAVADYLKEISAK